MKKKDLIISKVKNPKATFIFAHGAGAPMDHEWMESMTGKLTTLGIEVIRFEFPYMAERRETGKKRPPNSAKVLLETWHQVIELVGEKKKLYIGGKSMGGRMASLMADEVKVDGLICLGFPFHAPGKEPGARIDHLATLKTRSLIIQGTRDSMGTLEDVKSYKLSKKIKLHWLEDGDHGFKPRKSSGHTLDEHLESTAERILSFVQGK